MMRRMKVTNHIKNDGLHTTNIMLVEELERLVHQCKVSDRRFQLKVHVTEKRATTKLEREIGMVGKKTPRRRKCRLEVILEIKNEATRVLTWKVTRMITATMMGTEVNDYHGHGECLIRHR